MSIESMAHVLRHSRAKGTAKIVLLGIANHDGDGGSWPSISTLATYANVSTRNVQEAIKRLVDDGELLVLRQEGGTRNTRTDRRTNLYRVTVTRRADDGVTEASPRADHGVMIPTSRGDDSIAHGVTEASPEPSLNHPEPSKEHSPRPAAACDPDAADPFDAFWAAYPRSTDKAKARKAFVKAAAKVDAWGIIVRAARRMAEDPNLPEPQYVPHPTTWLNGERWDDPPYPPRNGGPRASTTDARVNEAMALARRLADEENGITARAAIGGRRS